LSTFCAPCLGWTRSTCGRRCGGGLGHDGEAHALVAAAVAEGRPWEKVAAVLESAAQHARGERRPAMERQSTTWWRGR
jgi:hypothetical protein